MELDIVIRLDAVAQSLIEEGLKVHAETIEDALNEIFLLREKISELESQNTKNVS